MKIVHNSFSQAEKRKLPRQSFILFSQITFAYAKRKTRDIKNKSAYGRERVKRILWKISRRLDVELRLCCFCNATQVVVIITAQLPTDRWYNVIYYNIFWNSTLIDVVMKCDKHNFLTVAIQNLNSCNTPPPFSYTHACVQLKTNGLYLNSFYSSYARQRMFYDVRIYLLFERILKYFQNPIVSSSSSFFIYTLPRF